MPDVERGVEEREYNGLKYWRYTDDIGTTLRGTVVLFDQGQLLALTRGGFVCPFTSEWAEIWWQRYNLERFFVTYPDYVLFGEVLGDNPYNSQRDPTIPPGLYFFIFEIMRSDGEFLRVHDRYELVESYELPTVPLLGQFTSDRIDELFEILRDLNNKEREGVV